MFSMENVLLFSMGYHQKLCIRSVVCNSKTCLFLLQNSIQIANGRSCDGMRFRRR